MSEGQSSLTKLLSDANGWKALQQFLIIVQPFYVRTQEVQAQTATIDMVLPAFDSLYNTLPDQNKTRLTEFMTTRILRCRQKLNLYRDRLENETPLYILAVVFDPRKKLCYFRKDRSDA